MHRIVTLRPYRPAPGRGRFDRHRYRSKVPLDENGMYVRVGMAPLGPSCTAYPLARSCWPGQFVSIGAIS